MANGIIREKRPFNIGSHQEPLWLTVGETWAGRHPSEQQLKAARHLADQVHPFLQGLLTPTDKTLHSMVAEKGFSVAYTTEEDQLKVWAFGRVQKIGSGIGGVALWQPADYLFHQFGVTTRHNVLTAQSLAEHPEGLIHRKAASALLWCAVEDLPEDAVVQMRLVEGDTRSDRYLSSHAGFRRANTDLEAVEQGDNMYSASVSTIRDNLMARDYSFLMWRQDNA